MVTVRDNFLSFAAIESGFQKRATGKKLKRRLEETTEGIEISRAATSRSRDVALM